MNQFHIILASVLSLSIVLGCSKEESFLDQKPNQSLIIPTTISDFEKILNNQELFNIITDHSLGTAASDEYYLPDAVLNGLSSEYIRNQYFWAPKIEEGSLAANYGSEWKRAYEQIFNCNVVLEGLEKLSLQEKAKSFYQEIKGRALFLRSWAFYNLIQTYAMPYDPATASSVHGIPLRLSSDINAVSVRATVNECYRQILEDLNTASGILPDLSVYKPHPSAVACLGFMARIYLAMAEYEKAMEYADLFLTKYPVLTDFNTLPEVRNTSISTAFLEEDVFQVSMNSDSPALRQRARIFKEFYDLYDDNDLRKTRYFRINNGEIFFKGSYTYIGNHYTGIATDEIYLIRAECYARSNQTELALQDLNHLLKFRWNAQSSFIPLQANTAKQALGIILTERRKELLFRGLRWTDLRRLNEEDGLKTVLHRVVNGKVYSLSPGDKRYVLPIPAEEIQLSGIQQNDRD